MEDLKARFPFCDSRFFGYLQTVLQRLPDDAQAAVIADRSFEILGGEAFHEKCMLHHIFDHPVNTVVYLNTKMLKEPDHRIILSIASEIAQWAVLGKTFAKAEKDTENLLRDWGFADEIEAVRYDQAVAKSADYRRGYQWAKKQNRDYLLQHFGLYFDQWNKRGWRQNSHEGSAAFDEQAVKASVLEDLSQFENLTPVDSNHAVEKTAPSQRLAILAGILAAVKEIELLAQHSVQTCDFRF